jgi:hypothetical protein
MDPNQVPNDADPNAAIGDSENDTDWKAEAEILKASLEDTQKSVESLKAESERNIRRLQSSYTQTINSISSQSDEERQRLQDRYDQEKMAGMEEGEALRYENARLAERLEQEASRRAQIQQRASDAAAAASYVQQFVNLGVPGKALNTTGSLQDLADSGWAALASIRAQESAQASEYQTKLSDIEKQLVELKAAPTDPTKLAESKGDLSPPKVASHTPGSQATGKNMYEVQKGLESFFGYIPSEEEVYRAVETGRLNSSVLPGLDTHQE